MTRSSEYSVNPLEILQKVVTYVKFDVYEHFMQHAFKRVSFSKKKKQKTQKN